MALNKLNSLNSLNGLNSLEGFGGVDDNGDLTPEELLSIAKANGGAVSEVAEELVHPERSILSTIGNGFKKAFKGFVDTISIPGEVVAGMISPNFTIGEAIDTHKRVSDAIFGDKNLFGGDEPTTLQKVGNFVVRLPIDILTDPLTYVTFGASAGVMGLKSLPKITTGLDDAGKVISKALSQEGADVLKFAKNIERQQLGTMSADNLANLVKTGEDLKTGLLQKGISQETIDFTEKELKTLLKETVESPLRPDYAKMTMTKLLEHNPALTETIMDKGGVKFFGKTILSSQRIDSVSRMIPGMTLLDNVTKPIRNSVNSLFDPAVIKVGSDFVRLPEEYVSFRQQLKDLGESLHVDAFRNMSNIQKQLNLNSDEWRLVMDSMSIRKIPADPRLATAYKTMLDLDEANLEMLKKAGVPIHNLENHTGLIFVGEDTRRIVKNSQFSKNIGAAQEATNAKFIEQKVMDITDTVPDMSKYADANPESELAKALGRIDGELVKSPQEIGFAIGRELDQKVKELTQPSTNVYYHGTGAKFDKFDSSKTGGTGFFFTKNKDEALSFAKGKNTATAEVKEVTLDIKNPAPLDEVQKAFDQATGGNPVKMAHDILKSKGYDGIIRKGETVVFSESQIKKATKGISLEDALKKPEIIKLQEMRDAVDKLLPNEQLVGKAEKLGLTKDEAGFFVNESGKIFKRVAASATELERAGFTGFDTNLLTAYTARTMQNQRQAVGQHFMEGLIRNFAKKVDEAPQSWTPIDNAGLFQKGIDIGIPLVSKEGAEYVFHPAISKAYQQMLEGITKDEVAQGFWNGYDKLLRYWKASVTSIFPMFHGRNAISNVFLNMLDLGTETFNPVTHTMSMDFIYKDRVANTLAKKMIGSGDEAVKASQEFSELMTRNVFTDKTGYTWTYGELRKAIKDNNIAFNPMVAGASDIDLSNKEALSKFFGLDQSKTQRNLQKINPFNAEQNLLVKGGREVGRAIEEQARLVNFITNLKKTGDVSHAAQRSKQFLFDYGNLTSFEKNVLRRLIPFYSFTKFNLQLQAKTLMSSPGRISGEIKAINSVAEIFGGEQLTDEEKKLLPSWMANSIALKRKGKDGQDEIISGFGTPIEQPFQQFQPNALLGSISPLIRYPVEAMTGYQFFRGKPTSEVIDAKNFKEAPKALRDYIGYSEYKGTTKDGKTYTRSISLKPGNMNFINNLPFAGRIISIFGNMTDQNISDQAKSLALITGVQARSADFQQLQEQQEELLRTQLEKVLKDAGIRGEFTRYYNRKNTEQITE